MTYIKFQLLGLQLALTSYFKERWVNFILHSRHMTLTSIYINIKFLCLQMTFPANEVMAVVAEIRIFVVQLSIETSHSCCSESRFTA